MVDTMQFTDQVALVTGAGKGTGRAIAEAFAANGAIVAGHDLTPINLDETVARIRSKGGRAHDYIFDVAKKMPVQAMVDQVVSDWGRIDILVNNTAVRPRISILKMDEWDWHRTVDVNLGGPFFTMQSVGRVMKDLGGGVIVNIAGGCEKAVNVSDHPAYYASMMGLIGLTRQAARELAAYQIRVHSVCQGFIEDDAMLNEEISIVGGGILQDARRSLHGVAEMVMFLCSPAASTLTGRIINLDASSAD